MWARGSLLGGEIVKNECGSGGKRRRRESESTHRQRYEHAQDKLGFPESTCCRCSVHGHERVGNGGQRGKQTEARLWEDLLE